MKILQYQQAFVQRFNLNLLECKYGSSQHMLNELDCFNLNLLECKFVEVGE